ncbi:MAG TPA: PadR family transcriptional regulator [Acidimicrobiales bacterium]|nr:PadR family transcriptional regulator [Acidimicrobiales bacterium]
MGHGHRHDHDNPLSRRPRRPGGRDRDELRAAAAFGRGRWGDGHRMRRGDMRQAIFAALRQGPAHGYEVMRRLEGMSGGAWRPSPGSIYPHLQTMQDEGLVRSEDTGGTRTYELTDLGSQQADGSEFTWPAEGEAESPARTLRQALGQLASAAKQLSAVGEPEQVDRGVAVLHRARKELYQILAED